MAGDTHDWRTLQSALARLVPGLRNGNRFPDRPPSLSPAIIDELIAEYAVLAPQHFELSKATATGAVVLKDESMSADAAEVSDALVQADEKMTGAYARIVSAIDQIDRFISLYQPDYPKVRKPGRKAHAALTDELAEIIETFALVDEEFQSAKDTLYDPTPAGTLAQRAWSAFAKGFKQYVADVKATRIKTFFELQPVPERGRLRPPAVALVDHMRGIHEGWSDNMSFTADPSSWKYFGNNWHIQTLAGRAMRVARRERRVWERLAADAHDGLRHATYAHHLDELSNELYEARTDLLRKLRTLRFAPETLELDDKSNFDELVRVFSETDDITDEGLFAVVDRIHAHRFGRPAAHERTRSVAPEGLERPGPTDLTENP